MAPLHQLCHWSEIIHLCACRRSTSSLHRTRKRITTACLCMGLAAVLDTSLAQAAPLPSNRQAVAAHVATSQTLGTVPVGWHVYRGAKVPFVIAYPPTWSVDETNASIGEVTFSLTTRAEPVSATIAMRRMAARQLPLTVLRAQIVAYATRACDQGRQVERTGLVTSGTARFATAIAECKSGEEAVKQRFDTVVFYVGVALKNKVQWTFLFQSSKKRFQTNQRKYFTSILRTFRP